MNKGATMIPETIIIIGAVLLIAYGGMKTFEKMLATSNTTQCKKDIKDIKAELNKAYSWMTAIDTKLEDQVAAIEKVDAKADANKLEMSNNRVKINGLPTGDHIEDRINHESNRLRASFDKEFDDFERSLKAGLSTMISELKPVARQTVSKTRRKCNTKGECVSKSVSRTTAASKKKTKKKIRKKKTTKKKTKLVRR